MSEKDKKKIEKKWEKHIEKRKKLLEDLEEEITIDFDEYSDQIKELQTIEKDIFKKAFLNMFIKTIDSRNSSAESLQYAFSMSQMGALQFVNDPTKLLDIGDSMTSVTSKGSGYF